MESLKSTLTRRVRRGSLSKQEEVAPDATPEVPEAVAKEQIPRSSETLRKLLQETESRKHEFEKRVKDKTVQSDPFVKTLLPFPSDDVVVRTLERKARTVSPSVPSESALKGVPQYVYKCLDFYRENWEEVCRTYADPQNSHQLPPFDQSKLSPLSYELFEEGVPTDGNLQKIFEKDTPTLKKKDSKLGAEIKLSKIEEPKDEVDASLLQAYGPTTDKENAENRKKDRNNVFNLFKDLIEVPQDEEETIPRPFKETVETRILVECKKLNWKPTHLLDPIFGVMALYDIHKKRKVSENFYFDLNSGVCLNLIDIPATPRSTFTESNWKSTKAIFHVTEASPDVVLIIRLERTLSGDLDTLYDFYANFDKLKDKEKDKMQNYIKVP